MSFCIHVPCFLRQNRILCRINAFEKNYDLHDLCFLILLSVFPFFQVFKHSTMWLLPICAAMHLLLFCSAIQEETIKIDFADFLVLLILLLQVSTAITGYGRTVDALTAALLTSVWFSARRFWGGEENQTRFAFLSSVALLIVSAIGVGQYLFGFAELRWVDASRFGDIGGRVTSLFSNPNILAVYLLLYFPLSLHAIFSLQNTWRMRLFYATTTVFCALCILLTWSRGAWLGLALEVVLFLLLHSKRSRKMLCLLPLMLLAIPLLPSNFRGRLYSIADLGESSIRYRLLTWQGTWKMLICHPFGIGVGERAWRAVFPHFAVSGTARVMHAHNILLQVAAELGVVGLLVFLLLIGKAIFCGVQQKNTAAVLAVAGALVMGLFDHFWYAPAMLVPFWSMNALCARSEQKVTKKSHFVDILHEK